MIPNKFNVNFIFFFTPRFSLSFTRYGVWFDADGDSAFVAVADDAPPVHPGCLLAGLAAADKGVGDAGRVHVAAGSALYPTPADMHVAMNVSWAAGNAVQPELVLDDDVPELRVPGGAVDQDGDEGDGLDGGELERPRHGQEEEEEKEELTQ